MVKQNYFETIDKPAALYKNEFLAIVQNKRCIRKKTTNYWSKIKLIN